MNRSCHIAGAGALVSGAARETVRSAVCRTTATGGLQNYRCVSRLLTGRHEQKQYFKYNTTFGSVIPVVAPTGYSHFHLRMMSAEAYRALFYSGRVHAALRQRPVIFAQTDARNIARRFVLLVADVIGGQVRLSLRQMGYKLCIGKLMAGKSRHGSKRLLLS